MYRTLTRRQLYDMIWERALTRVAPELGISDVALRKQCVKHDIPLPDARYRGLVNAGKPAVRKPLPVSGNAAGDRIVIHVTGQQTPPPEVAAAVAAQRAVAPAIVPDVLHPLVKRTLAAARSSTVDNNGAVRCNDTSLFRIRAHPDTLDRVGGFLNRLVYAALARGWSFEPEREGLGLVAEGENLGFAVNQTIRRSPHVATPEETQKRDRWDARNGNNWSNWSQRPQIAQHDFTPTGEMSLEIEAWSSHNVAPRRFADRRQVRIEDRIDDIMLAFVAFAADRVLSRAEAAERARLEDIARRERARLQRLAELEEERVAWLETRLALQEERDRLHRFLAQFGAPAVGGEGAFETFLRWAHARLAGFDHQLTVKGMAGELASMAAFGTEGAV